MKGILVSYAPDDTAAYSVVIDAQGRMTSRERLRPGGGQLRFVANPDGSQPNAPPARGGGPAAAAPAGAPGAPNTAGAVAPGRAGGQAGQAGGQAGAPGGGRASGARGGGGGGRGRAGMPEGYTNPYTPGVFEFKAERLERLRSAGGRERPARLAQQRAGIRRRERRRRRGARQLRSDRALCRWVRRGPLQGYRPQGSRPAHPARPRSSRRDTTCCGCRTSATAGPRRWPTSTATDSPTSSRAPGTSSVPTSPCRERSPSARPGTRATPTRTTSGCSMRSTGPATAGPTS